MSAILADHCFKRPTPFEQLHAAATLGVAGWVVWTALGSQTPIGFVIFWCAGLVTLAGAARFPALGVYVFIALTYGTPRYHSAFVTMVQLGVPNWVCVLGLLGAVVWITADRRRSREVGWLTRLIVMLVLWLSVTMAAAAIRGQPWQPHPRHHPQQYFQSLIMFLVASCVLTNRDQAWRCAMAICLALCVRGILAGRQGIYLEGDISSLCVMAMPLALLGLSATPRRGLRIGFALLLVTLAVLLSFTYNRAAAVGFVVLLVVLWALSRYKWRILAISIPALILAGTLFTSSYYWQRFTGIWEGNSERNSVESRLRIWHAGWQMFVDHPIFGVGTGNFHNLVQKYDPQLGEAFAGHNNFIEILAESGAPGLALYTLLFAAGLVSLWQTSQLAGPHWPGPGARFLSASLYVYLTIGLFISRQDLVLAYLLLGWSAAIRNQLPDRQPSASGPLIAEPCDPTQRQV